VVLVGEIGFPSSDLATALFPSECGIRLPGPSESLGTETDRRWSRQRRTPGARCRRATGLQEVETVDVTSELVANDAPQQGRKPRDPKMPQTYWLLTSLLGLCPRPRDLSHRLKARPGNASEADHLIGLGLASSPGSALELVPTRALSSDQEKTLRTPLDKPGPIEGLGLRSRRGSAAPTRPLPRPTSPRGGDSNAVSDKVG
jgi:hypothetical protein